MAYSFLDLAKDVLEQENVPLTVGEIWEAAERQGLLEKLSSSGKTPMRTLSARIYVDIMVLFLDVGSLKIINFLSTYKKLGGKKFGY